MQNHAHNTHLILQQLRACARYGTLPAHETRGAPRVSCVGVSRHTDGLYVHLLHFTASVRTLVPAREQVYAKRARTSSILRAQLCARGRNAAARAKKRAARKIETKFQFALFEKHLLSYRTRI